MSYLFSAKENSFYCFLFKDAYEKAGTWPDDLVDVTDDIYREYSGDAAKGRKRGCSSEGAPCWADLELHVNKE